MKSQTVSKLIIAFFLSVNLPGTAVAGTQTLINSAGRDMFRINYLEPGENFIVTDFTENTVASEYSQYSFSPKLQSALNFGAQYYADLLAPQAQNCRPLYIVVSTRDNWDNASTMSINLKNDSNQYVYTTRNYLPAAIQQGTELAAVTDPLHIGGTQPATSPCNATSFNIGSFMGAIRPGSERGWWTESSSGLPDNEQAADLPATIRHEMSHALGISSAKIYSDEWTSSPTEKLTLSDMTLSVSDKYGNLIYSFSPEITDKNSWNLHLVDQYGNPAKPGMTVLTSADFAELNQAKGSTLQRSDYFIIDNPNDTAVHETLPTTGKAYFTGKNVSEILDGATFDGINGIPVNTWQQYTSQEGHYIYSTDFSHPELTNSSLSHQNYRNYTVPLEAELGILQDLGYSFDRKNLYGFSLYKDNTIFENKNGYSARTADGTSYIYNSPNVTPLAVGVHIFGKNNQLTQASDILSAGEGSTGIRVDGEANKLIIPETTTINTNGKNANGLLFAYGRNHTLDLAGTVTAEGEKGTAVRFDFGSNILGASPEYRGSYMRYRRLVNSEDGSFAYSANYSINPINTYIPPAEIAALNGPLVTDFNLSGSISGKENAIYISKNAFVKNININEGAKIIGNITSDWKHFATDGSYDGHTNTSFIQNIHDPLGIQYNGGVYLYSTYIPPLVTNLNFNTGIDYNGNISGRDNIKLNLNRGTLNFNGQADVISVNIGEKASLFGGSLTVTPQLIGDYLWYIGTGQVINHGTLGAATPVSTSSLLADNKPGLTVNGMLVSDGRLRFTANRTNAGTINVSGSVSADGSILCLDPAGIYVPDYSYPFIYEKGRLKNIRWADANENRTGMLTAYSDKGLLIFRRENNLNSPDTTENNTFTAMSSLYDRLDVNGQDAMLPLFSLQPAAARSALCDINGNDIAAAATLMQRSNHISNAICSRFSDHKATSPDYNFWLKYDKNLGTIGNIHAGTHSSTMTLGWDKQVSPHWRFGFLGSYGTAAFTAPAAANRLRDFRLGLYAGWQNKADNSWIYLDYGWGHNTINRSVRCLKLNGQSSFNSHILELGGEYKHDLHHADGKVWHVSPYASTRLSLYTQDSWSETGLGPYNQNINRQCSTTFDLGVGLEFKRNFSNGNYALRTGLRHAFCGTNPLQSFSYIADNSQSFSRRTDGDRTLWTLNLGGEYKFAPDWSISGETVFERGPHDRNLSLEFEIKYTW